MLGLILVPLIVVLILAPLYYWGHYDTVKEALKDGGWVTHKRMCMREARALTLLSDRGDSIGVLPPRMEYQIYLAQYGDSGHRVSVSKREFEGIVLGDYVVCVGGKCRPIAPDDPRLQQYLESRY